MPPARTCAVAGLPPCSPSRSLIRVVLSASARMMRVAGDLGEIDAARGSTQRGFALHDRAGDAAADAIPSRRSRPDRFRSAGPSVAPGEPRALGADIPNRRPRSCDAARRPGLAPRLQPGRTYFSLALGAYSSRAPRESLLASRHYPRRRTNDDPVLPATDLVSRPTTSRTLADPRSTTDAPWP